MIWQLQQVLLKVRRHARGVEGGGRGRLRETRRGYLWRERVLAQVEDQLHSQAPLRRIALELDLGEALDDALEQAKEKKQALKKQAQVQVQEQQQVQVLVEEQVRALEQAQVQVWMLRRALEQARGLVRGQAQKSEREQTVVKAQMLVVQLIRVAVRAVELQAVLEMRSLLMEMRRQDPEGQQMLQRKLERAVPGLQLLRELSPDQRMQLRQGAEMGHKNTQEELRENARVGLLRLTLQLVNCGYTSHAMHEKDGAIFHSRSSPVN